DGCKNCKTAFVTQRPHPVPTNYNKKYPAANNSFIQTFVNSKPAGANDDDSHKTSVHCGLKRWLKKSGSRTAEGAAANANNRRDRPSGSLRPFLMKIDFDSFSVMVGQLWNPHFKNAVFIRSLYSLMGYG